MFAVILNVSTKLWMSRGGKDYLKVGAGICANVSGCVDVRVGLSDGDCRGRGLNPVDASPLICLHVFCTRVFRLHPSCLDCKERAF